MIDRLLAIFAFAVLCGFLAILVFKVGRLDLSLVVGFSMIFAGWDLVGSLRRGGH